MQMAILERNVHHNPQTDDDVKANCNACILNNVGRYALRNLNVDKENAVLNIYGYF